MTSSTFGVSLLFMFFRSAFLVRSATLTYDFNITWVNANPDGAFDRPVIGINGQWPLPPITATVGDRVIINVDNQLGNQSTSLHFHGLFMNGTTHMDGPVGVTQCPIPPGGSFKYDFKVCLSTKMSTIAANLTGRPTWHLLVPLACQWTVPRWS